MEQPFVNNSGSRGMSNRGQQQADLPSKQLASIRSSSAPPVMPNDFQKSGPSTAENINPHDPRLDPAYYVYYYSQRPSDHRLPQPLISPYNNYSTFFNNSLGGSQSSLSGPNLSSRSGGLQDLSGHPHLESLLADDEPNQPWPSNNSSPHKDRGNNAIGTEMHLKPKSLVDKIQSDFPRTPSPIYQKTKSEELLGGLPNPALPNAGMGNSGMGGNGGMGNNGGNNRSMMSQPQPQQARSHSLHHNSNGRNQKENSYYDPTSEITESMGDMSIYNDKMMYNNEQYNEKRGMQYQHREKIEDEYDQPIRLNDNRHMYSNHSGGGNGGYYGNMQGGYNQGGNYMNMPNMGGNNGGFGERRNKSQGGMYGGMGSPSNDYYNTWSDAPSNDRMTTEHRKFNNYNQNYGHGGQGRDHMQDMSPPGGRNMNGSRSYASPPTNTANHRNNNNNNGYYAGTPSSPKDTSRSSLLEEFRMNKNRKWESNDIMGHVVEFSGDQHGSRFIQQKLESCSEYDKENVFNEILPHAMQSMVDVFGNYVIQKFFEYGSHEQKLILSERIMGHVLSSSLQMYGCRVIQKAIEGVDREQHEWIAKESEGNIMKCVKDQNGNHVIQKCIERMPADLIQFIIDSFHGEVFQSATHSYGCRVVQRISEHAEDSQRDPIMDESMKYCPSSVQDKYGNYVIQHVSEHGKLKDKSIIISKMRGQIVQLSQHKFASNVIEKCVQYGTPVERLQISEEINTPNGKSESSSVIMMKDQFANYVIQKIIDVVDDHQRESLVQRIRPHLPASKKCTYSKHIVSHVEKLLNK